MRAPFLRTTPICLILLLAGCVGTNPPPAPEGVLILDDVFDPIRFHAVSGETVTWTSQGRGTHTVTVQDPNGDPGEWLYNEELIPPGGTAAFAFPNPGTYDVFCIYHSQGAAGDFSGGMVMTVVVT
jgi:plastocyanin